MKLIRHCTFILLVLSSFVAVGQKQATNWYFGEYAGLNFSSGSPVALTDGRLITKEGCATISDEDGNLIFYTDGINVWNRNHRLMPNGTGLLGNPSSSQSAIVIPFPGDTKKFYIFTVAAFNAPDGLNYGVVDMTLDGGLGDLIPSQKIVHLTGSMSEKVTAVFHANQEDIWVIAHKMNSNNFYAYRVTRAGVDPTPVISSTGILYVAGGGGVSAIGCLKASPDGKKLASANTYDASKGLQLFDFDTATGVVSNPMTLIDNTDTSPPYGVEFSPNSNLLYASTTGTSPKPVVQYDLTSNTEAVIKASKIELTPPFQYYSSLQLGLDGKIYVTEYEQTTLAVINNPNVLGAGCSFASHAINLAGRLSKEGLPPFIQSYFNQEIKAKQFCVNSPTLFSVSINANIQSATWNFGDGSTSTAITTDHTYTTPGTYDVSVDFILNSAPEIIHLDKKITIEPLPVANRPADMNMCVLAGQAATYNLALQTPVVLGTQPPADFTVTYHLTQADADAGNAITTLTHSTASETVIVKIKNNLTGCIAFTQFQAIRSVKPVANAPQPLKSCSTTTTAIFNLAANTGIILGAQDPAIFSVDYYTSAQLATAGTAGTAIATPAAYVSADATCYARIYNMANPQCFDITSFSLSVLKSPVLNPAGTPFNYVLCPDPGSTNTAVVNTLQAVAGNLQNNSFSVIPLLDPASAQDADLANYVVSYHATLSDAQANSGALSNGFTATDGQSIFLRIQHTSLPDCYSVATIIFYIRLPQTTLPSPLHACEDSAGKGIFNLSLKNNEITNALAYNQIKYYDTQAAATAGGNNNLTETAYEGTDGQIVYARATDTRTGCAATVPLTLLTDPAPIAPVPAAIEECDPNNDNVAVFNLQPTLDAIVAALGGTVTATVHETEEDANYQGGTNPVRNVTNYTNIKARTTNGIQTLYIRISSTATTCYDVVPVQLVVHPTPVATDPLQVYEMCDNGSSDTDGKAIFDLTTYQNIVLNTMNPGQFSVGYHATQADAVAGIAIPNPALYESANGIIYIKVTNNATGCYDIVALELKVNPLPVIVQPQPYTLCDVNDPGDEKEIFDLTSRISEITRGAMGLTTTFFSSYAEALSDTNPITTGAAYRNKAVVDPIFVKVSDNDTGCYRIVLLDIRVEPLPRLTLPTQDQLTACDTNGFGYGNFNLDALVPWMVNNGVGLTVSFYQTRQNALDNTNPINNTANYENVNSYSEIIYAVATDKVTGCRSEVMELQLIIAPAPKAFILQDLTYCDDEDKDNQDAKTKADLTVQNTVIEAQLGVSPNTYTITYYTDEASAQAGMPRITTPASYPVYNGQQLWVRAEVPGTECYQVSSFKIIVNIPQELAVPNTYVLCDDSLDNDGFTTFDLTSQDEYILTPTGIGEGNKVEYFKTVTDRDNNNPIPHPESFRNTVNAQTLHVLVTTPQGCESYSTITLIVVPLPVPNTAPPALEACDVNNPGDGLEQFNLDDATANILNNSSQAQVAYYTTQAAAEAGITTVAEYIGNGGPYTSITPWNDSVWARVSRTDTQPGSPVCWQVVELPLVVNPLPPIYDSNGVVPYYAICSPSTSGVETFNLIGYVSDLITAFGQNPLDYTIRFYHTYADYVAGIALPHVYTNTGNPVHDTVYVYARNNKTRCFIITTLELFAEQAAVANPVTGVNNPLVRCDYFGANDGIINDFDLTPAGAEALGNQNPVTYTVEYYTNEAAARAGDNNPTNTAYIVNPSAYTNLSSPQVVWIRITNTTTQSKCYALTSFEIRAEKLAEPVINASGNTVCVNNDGSTERPVTLTVSNYNAGYTYTWYRDGVDVTVNPLQNYYVINSAPGSYTVAATSTTTADGGAGCISQQSPAFIVIQSGQASKIGKGYAISNAFSDDQSVTVLVEGNGDYQYALEEVGPWQNSNVFTNVAPGYHTIYVRDAKTDEPCGQLVIEGVSIIDYPRYFTPNGDGFHDYWNITGMAEGYEDARIYIFDRYGKLIKQLSPKSRTDRNQGWDGTYNGHPLPSDDYWFTVEFTENGMRREFRAHFAMKR